MGKLKELLEEYKMTPVGVPRNEVLKDEIKKIVESDWWHNTIGTEFKWPSKRLKSSYGITPDMSIGNFDFFSFQFCSKCHLLSDGSPLMLEDGRIPFWPH